MFFVIRYLASKTVVLVTHQLQFIKSVDQVVIMDKGKIIGNGAFEELDVNIQTYDLDAFGEEYDKLSQNIVFVGKRTEDNSADERESARSA